MTITLPLPRMKLNPLPAFSQLVSTSEGVGFWDEKTRTLRKSFCIHVAPEPTDVRPATEAEAKEFFTAREFHADELRRHYDSADRRGVPTGD